MDLSYPEVARLSKEDVMILGVALENAKQSYQIEKLITKNCKFKIGQKKIEVWSGDGGNNIENVTYSGFWEAEYLMGKRYKIECTAAAIYEYMMADYLLQNYPERLTNQEKEKYPEMAKAFKHFFEFVNRLKEES